MFFAERRNRLAAEQRYRDYLAAETMVAVQRIAEALERPARPASPVYDFDHDQWKFDMLQEIGYRQVEDLARLPMEPIAVLEETNEIVVNEVLLDEEGKSILRPDHMGVMMKSRILPLPEGFEIRDMLLPDGTVRRFPVRVGA